MGSEGKNYLYITNFNFFCDLFYEVVVKTPHPPTPKKPFNLDKIINSDVFNI